MRPDPVTIAVPLAPPTVLALRGTARHLGISMDVLMQAAWWATLGRLAGGWAFLGGWQHDCRRDYAMLAGSIGVYEKILPVALDWRAGTPFSDCAIALAATLAGHVQAQEYWAVDAPAGTGHLGAGFQYIDEPDLTGASLCWSPREMPGPAPAFELAMQVGMRAEEARLALSYAGQRYPAWAMQALLAQYAALLAHVAEAPGTPLAGLRLLDEPARQALLSRQGEPLDVGSDALPAVIARWARTHPDALALRDARQELSYADLERRVAGMAAALRRLGLRRGHIAALRLPRDAELVVAMLAAWRCGAAYLPLEPDWPDARCAAIVQAARPGCVVVASGVPEGAAAAWAGSLPVAMLRDLVEGDDPHAAPAPQEQLPGLDDIAYVLFTSGSTGEPKGVPIAHRQLLNYVAAASHAMGLGQSRRWALTGTVAADLGNTALFGALYNGGALVVAAPDDMRDGRAFARFLAAHAIDGIKIVPSHLEALLDDEHSILPARIVLGGEAASAALVRRIAALAPHCALYNHYGPTESTVGVMIHAVGTAEAAAGAAPTAVDSMDTVAAATGPGRDGMLPLTRVLANCRVYVLEADMSPTPTGGVGQVYLGGAQLCDGYLGGRASDAFVDDPYRPGERLYRSGDLACVLADGAIRLAGRADDQVKIRGHRVEPAEVEARLLALPDVRQAAVVAVPAPGGAALTAFVVAKAASDGPAPDTPAGIGATDPARIGQGAGIEHDALIEHGRQVDHWRRQLSATLPDPMLPSRIVVLPAFPRLANGKIDRQALAARARQETTRGPARATAPRDALEAVVASRFAELLDRPALAMDEDFFAAGGHSLLAIKLVTRLRKALKVELPPAAVFDHPTAAALAAELRRRAPDPAMLDRIAQARKALDAMTPQQRAALATAQEDVRP